MKKKGTPIVILIYIRYIGTYIINFDLKYLYNLLTKYVRCTYDNVVINNKYINI